MSSNSCYVSSVCLKTTVVVVNTGWPFLCYWRWWWWGGWVQSCKQASMWSRGNAVDWTETEHQEEVGNQNEVWNRVSLALSLEQSALPLRAKAQLRRWNSASGWTFRQTINNISTQLYLIFSQKHDPLGWMIRYIKSNYWWFQLNKQELKRERTKTWSSPVWRPLMSTTWQPKGLPEHCVKRAKAIKKSTMTRSTSIRAFLKRRPAGD